MRITKDRYDSLFNDDSSATEQPPLREPFKAKSAEEAAAVKDYFNKKGFKIAMHVFKLCVCDLTVDDENSINEILHTENIAEKYEAAPEPAAPEQPCHVDEAPGNSSLARWG